MKVKIRSVVVNNRKKSVEIVTKNGLLSLPFSRLPTPPTSKDPIVKIFVDRELENMGITYVLKSGQEDAVLLDAFLDYNRDPDYVRQWMIYHLTIQAQDLLKKSDLSKHEITRRLKTSPSQLARLLNHANTRKSLDEMLRLIAVLGYRLEWLVVKDVA